MSNINDGSWSDRCIGLENELADAQARIGMLEGALRYVKEFFLRLEQGTSIDDPLYEIRRKVHAPVHTVIDSALVAPKVDNHADQA